MARISVLVLMMVMLSASLLSADEVDNTFEKVNKHLYGVDGAGNQGVEQPAAEPEPPPPPPPTRKRTPSRPLPAEEAVAAPIEMAAGDDDHYIQGDDYFIADQPLGDNSWIYVRLAKLTTPPSGQTKGDAKFMQVTDGKEVWTKYFWKTRKASNADLKLGTMVIMCEIGGDDSTYRAPNSKEEGRSSNWFMAKITDMSDTYRGYVTVSGPYKASLNNLRILLPGGSYR